MAEIIENAYYKTNKVTTSLEYLVFKFGKVASVSDSIMSLNIYFYPFQQWQIIVLQFYDYYESVNYDAV